MLGFSIMMWFVALILTIVGIALLKGNHSGMHGKAYDKASDKEAYAKKTGRPVIMMAIGTAIAGFIAVFWSISKVIYYSLALVVIVAVAGIIWIYIIGREININGV